MLVYTYITSYSYISSISSGGRAAHHRWPAQRGPDQAAPRGFHTYICIYIDIYIHIHTQVYLFV